MAWATFADERFPGVGIQGLGTRHLATFLEGRGEDNPLELASWNAETFESVFFDDIETEEVESADELILISLVRALDRLSDDDLGDGAGGFGTADQSEWLGA